MMQRTMSYRWKRYLACYYYERWRRIRRLHWWYGGSTRRVPETIQHNYSPAEKLSSEEYDKLIQNYIRSTKIEITTALSPPVSVYVDIEILTNIGTIQLENGTLTLNRGSYHHVRRSDVEHLILRKAVREFVKND